MPLRASASSGHTEAGPAVSLAEAQSGQMPLHVLLDLAQRWHDAGQPEAASVLYAAWIANTVSPLKHVACFNHGTLLAELGRDAEAETSYRQALAMAPTFAQAHLNLGHALERRGDAEGALAEWQQVLDTVAADTPDSQPLRLHALNNMARLQEQRRQFAQSEALMVRSLTLKPAQYDVLQHYVHIRQKQCEWPLYTPVGQVSANQMLVGTSPLAMLSVSDDPALQLMAAQRFVHERVMRPPETPLYRTQAPRSGRIRIGYLSGDLHMHAVGLLTAELFELHDQARFEVHAFSWSTEDGSPLRARLRHAIEHYHPIATLNDTQAAQQIAAAGIDVLVDLQGLTSGARPNILVQQPAPVQVSYLGFPGTCGLPGVDWVLADDFVMPTALEPFCTERPLRMPVCFQVSDRQRELGAPPTRAQYQLPEDAVVFCSFNNNFKFTQEVFGCWMRILAAVPGSVLWLLADNDWARDNMLNTARAHGVDPARLIFAPRVAPPDYLARFTLADLMLDTFPYNAGTTASDALWMGLPILTLAGRSIISRMAGSLLTAIGLPDLITDTLADYERLAVTLGRQPARLASIKRYLSEHGRSSPLFDVPARVRDIEAALEPLALAARQAP
jgi:predicted O-linked N-acetylglucosamine transferase (SPINDLY family)